MSVSIASCSILYRSRFEARNLPPARYTSLEPVLNNAIPVNPLKL
jgi:hypothetical protein